GRLLGLHRRAHLALGRVLLGRALGGFGGVRSVGLGLLVRRAGLVLLRLCLPVSLALSRLALAVVLTEEALDRHPELLGLVCHGAQHVRDRALIAGRPTVAFAG